MTEDQKPMAADQYTNGHQNGHMQQDSQHQQGDGQTTSQAQGDRAQYSLVQDPLFLITVAAFALITTGFPAALGQFRFMPLIQTIALTAFLSLAVRRGRLRAAYSILGIWIFVQFTSILTLTLIRPAQLERAIVEGFSHRQGLLEWIYTASAYPSGLAANPVAYIVEFMGIVIGGLVTAGLVGIWFLMRLINLTAYSIGTLTPVAEGTLALLVPLLLWHILRIVGYAALMPLVATPALSGVWSPTIYWQTHRRPILFGLALVIAGILLELLAAPLWPALMPEM